MADILTLRKFEALSPFEIKNELIDLAKKTSQDHAVRVPECRPRQSQLDRHHAARRLLPARPVRHHRKQTGDGAVRPGSAACRRPKASPLASTPGSRSTRICPVQTSSPSMVKFAIKTFKFDRDAFVHELVDSIIGDNYPVPDRMLVHNERIVHEYLMWAMCGNPRPSGKFDLYAVEGGTAAMCYIFKSLKANRLLFPGDTIALGTPIFTPYLEMTHLEDYDLKVVNISSAAGEPLPIHGCRDQEARGPEDQGILHRQSRQSYRHGDEQGNDRQDREPGEDQAPRPDVADGRRVRNVRRRFPLPARRASAEHDRRLFLFQVFRLHRLAAWRHRDPRGQHLRQDDRQTAGRACESAGQALRPDDARTAQDSSSSIASLPTVATSVSTTLPGFRCRSR